VIAAAESTASSASRGWLGCVVVLAALDVAGWAFVLHRGPAKSTYVPRVGAFDQAPLSPIPTPSPTSAAQSPALALPDTNGKPPAVSIVSDSIGAGDYASSADRPYRVLLETALRARGAITADDVGAPAGSKSTNVKVPGGQDLVVLEVGTTDLSGTDLKTFTANYIGLVAATRASSPKAGLVCAGTWSRLGANFDAVIQAACDYADGAFVSLQPLYSDAANRGPAGVAGPYGTSDDEAPNDAGHRAIAAALLGAVGLNLT
jgi:acyl-CoA thioesterase-1